MEQLNLEATQSILRERHAQVVRDAETRRMLRERSAGRPADLTDTAQAPARTRFADRLAGLLRPARRPAVS